MREVTVEEASYAFIFLSNENLTQVDVHFDDVKVSHTHSPVVAGADYYPFGLVITEREIDDEPYRYGYQGQFSEKDDATDWNQFTLRSYDPRVGRWNSVDYYGQYVSRYLAMGNNPTIRVDADGGTDFVNRAGQVIATDNVENGRAVLVHKGRDLRTIRRNNKLGQFTFENQIRRGLELPTLEERTRLLTLRDLGETVDNQEFSMLSLRTRGGHRGPLILGQGPIYDPNRPSENAHVDPVNDAEFNIFELARSLHTSGQPVIIAHTHNVDVAKYTNNEKRPTNRPSPGDYYYKNQYRTAINLVINNRRDEVYVLEAKKKYVTMTFKAFFKNFRTGAPLTIRRLPRYNP